MAHEVSAKSEGMVLVWDLGFPARLPRMREQKAPGEQLQPFPSPDVIPYPCLDLRLQTLSAAYLPPRKENPDPYHTWLLQS